MHSAVFTDFPKISFTCYFFFYSCIHFVAGTALSSETAVKQSSKSGLRERINHYHNERETNAGERAVCFTPPGAQH